MNGKRGDHPLTDILNYGQPVFGETIDDLVKQVAEYMSGDRLYALFPWFSPPEPEEFERQLRAKLQELEVDAKARGWEPKG